MTQIQNKFIIIIPTRNSSDTLKYTLKTCIEQLDYNNYTIIVSDNNSSDNTKTMVEGFNSKQIQYINTFKDVAMNKNWEFALNYALSHYDSGYITYIGSDDGITPEALKITNDLINKYHEDVVYCCRPTYTWPLKSEDTELGDGEIYFKLSNHTYIKKSSSYLEQMAIGKRRYSELPSIYYSFININLIQHIISTSKDGLFFTGIAPDVYSAITITSQCESFLYVEYPLTLAGISTNSNGRATLSFENDDCKRKRLDFQKLDNTQQLFKYISSVKFAEYEALLIAKENLSLKIQIPHKRWVKQILTDLQGSPKSYYLPSIEALYKCKSIKPFLPNIESILNKYPNDNNRNNTELKWRGYWAYCKSRNLNNIDDASRWIYTLFSCKKPQGVKNIFFVRISEKIQSTFQYVLKRIAYES